MQTFFQTAPAPTYVKRSSDKYAMMFTWTTFTACALVATKGAWGRQARPAPLLRATRAGGLGSGSPP